jgi:hypothetical protein
LHSTLKLSTGILRRIRIPLIVAIVLSATIGAATYAYTYNSAPRSLPFHTFSYGYGAPFYSTTLYLVINNELSLASVWNSTGACSSHQSPCTPPQVDMNQRTVIAVFFGLKGSSGYAINITQVTSNDSGITANVLMTVPGNKCGELAILTAPFHMVDITKVNVPISFTNRVQTTNC